MAEEEFNCKPTDKDGNLIGMGILMDGFKELITAFIQPYLMGFEAFAEGKLPAMAADGSINEFAKKVVPATAMLAGGLAMKAKVEKLPPIPLPSPLGAMGGMPGFEPDDPVPLALVGLVNGLAMGMLPGIVAGGAGVVLKDMVPAAPYLQAPEPPSFPGAITQGIKDAKIPGLGAAAAEQLVKCVQVVMEEALGPLGPGGGEGEGEGEGEEGTEET